MLNEKIKIIEEYVLSLPAGPTESAHNADHWFRVRDWAINVAKSVGYQKLDLVHAAALMHDISKSDFLEKGISHGEVSAKMAKKFLSENNLFTVSEINEICEAISYHNTAIDRHHQLLDILRDGDILDLSGAIGIVRGALGAPKKPVFDRTNIRGRYFGKTNIDYNKIFSLEGKLDVGLTVIDDYNFQTSCFENLKSSYAREVAKPMQEFMKAFILQVEREANLNKE